MSRMFDTYNTLETASSNYFKKPIKIKPLQSLSTTSLLTNIKGEAYGVEVKYGMPFVLYFHVDELQNLAIDEFIKQSTVEFSLVTQRHKKVLELNFLGKDIFTEASDLVISVSSEAISTLKRESYGICLELKHQEEIYPLFSEHDGLLTIR